MQQSSTRRLRHLTSSATRVIAVRYYPPVPNSPFAWAHVERGIIDFGNGHHCHLFRDRSGVWKVSMRDILKGRITREDADILNRRLGRKFIP